MVVRKRLMVLANAVRNHREEGRCIAGREVVDGPAGLRLGGWVRPVSGHGEGELWCSERRYPDGGWVRVLDVADVELAGPVGDPDQPENWVLAGEGGWAELTRSCRPPLDGLEETPPGLWLQPGGPTDRVSHGYLAAHPPGQSLYVVRPEEPRLVLGTEPGPGHPKRRRRCLFRYAGLDYDLALTDPKATEQYERRFPAPGQSALVVPLPGDRTLLCVSLARPFNGYHYKLVATVFEDPRWVRPRRTLGSLLSVIRTTLWGRSSTSSGGTG
ncbi:MAG: hypothetical protein K2X82_16220 [Gemmataceae bacterium]|nr:hypothetical protein [Gemmataceae bacterium]